MPHHIFVSYSHDNATETAILVNKLRSTGYIVIQDVEHLKGSDLWKEAIKSAIEEASMFIVLWSAPAANPNRYVTVEMGIAKAAHIRTMALLLDQTPLDDDYFKDRQAISVQNTIDQAAKKVISDLRERIPDLQYPRENFVFDKALGDQDPVEIPNQHNAPLVKVPLLMSGYCRAYIVGLRTTRITSPSMIQLCLQFLPNDAFVPTVYHYVVKTPTIPAPFTGLLISGPKDGTARLSESNSSEWIDCINTTVAAVNVLKQKAGVNPTLHVFAQAPTVLMLGIGERFFKFWHIHLYNFAPPDSYTQAYEIVPENMR